VQKLFLGFLQEYREEEGDGMPASQVEATYVRYLQELKDCDRTTLFVDFNHLVECVRLAQLAGLAGSDCSRLATRRRQREHFALRSRAHTAAHQLRRHAGARGSGGAVLPLRAVLAQGAAGASGCERRRRSC